MPRLRTLFFAALACLAAPARAEDLRYPHLERLFQSRERGGPEIVRGGRPSYDPFRRRAPGVHRVPDVARPEARRPVRDMRPRIHAPALAAAPAPAATAPVPKTFFVAVIGDAMSMMLADGLADSLARERPQVEVMRRGRDNSGVVREDYFDWRKTAREMAAGADRIDYAVVMMGANDRQPMRRDGATLDTLSEPWREAYGARIAEIVGAFRARNIPVIWVGLPVMRAERYGADMKTLNALARAAAEKAGATYVETWDRFASEAGAFEAEGPDVNGRVTRLRTSDGIYFTRAGALKLAHFVEGEIARAAGAPAILAPPPMAIPPPPLAVSPDAPGAAPPLLGPVEIDVGALIRREAGSDAAALAPAEPAQVLPGVPPPEPLPAPVFPTRPAAGPVAPLTQPPRAPDGKLAAGPPARPTPSEPKPGRGDDFAWPRR